MSEACEASALFISCFSNCQNAEFIANAKFLSEGESRNNQNAFFLFARNATGYLQRGIVKELLRHSISLLWVLRDLHDPLIPVWINIWILIERWLLLSWIHPLGTFCRWPFSSHQTNRLVADWWPVTVGTDSSTLKKCMKEEKKQQKSTVSLQEVPQETLWFLLFLFGLWNLDVSC